MERKLSDMMCRSFIKGNEVPDTSSVGSIDAETVALARPVRVSRVMLKCDSGVSM